MRTRTAALALGAAASLVIGLASPPPAGAGVALEEHITGLTNPLAFVQDPSDPSVQYIVQQDGLIRVVQDGALLSEPFADLSGVTGSLSGETGLLGLAFPPDFADSGACYVSYTDAEDDSVVARLMRSGPGALTADISTLTPLLETPQPADNNNGGHIAFGPDGFLYIALGDGGGAGDIEGNAQNRANLLGSILRVDVSDASLDGFTIPADNPFVGVEGARDEIWSYGLRNPWRFTFDTGACGTGAMLIGDLGLNAREEINFEPPGAGGRNYGWNCREGFLTFLGCAPPQGETFTDPIFDYSLPVGQSITGGFVYRGAAMPTLRGRYFYADFISGQLWSLDVAGGAAGDNIEHLDTGLFFSSFGRDAAGELFILDFFGGRVLRIVQTEPQADLDLNGVVDGADLGALLGQWGADACGGPADLNLDGVVDGADLGSLLGQWGP